MKIRNLLGLFALGALAVYVQRRRGGEVSIEGFKKTGRELIRALRGKVSGERGARGKEPSGSGARRSDERGSERGIAGGYSTP